MTDRELLELAAKAAGAMQHERNQECWLLPRNDGIWRVWQPLTDDGDALRLAVVLGIVVLQMEGSARAGAEGLECDFSAPYAAHGNDRMKATRKVIVAAAAEIGRAMP